jgi:hypothetical protein
MRASEGFNREAQSDLGKMGRVQKLGKRKHEPSDLPAETENPRWRRL